MRRNKEIARVGEVGEGEEVMKALAQQVMRGEQEMSVQVEDMRSKGDERAGTEGDEIPQGKL